MKMLPILMSLLMPVVLVAQHAKDTLLLTLKNQYRLTTYDIPSERIIFNKDTLLIAGYLGDVTYSVSNIGQPKNIIYKTMDGGRHWKSLKFNGDAWIYDTYWKKDGKIWMGGSDTYLHYSTNFGESWQRKTSPFNSEDRVLSIFMKDSEVGIVGGLHNRLAITRNNWATTQQIPTPLDQNKFTITANSSRDRIDRVAMMNSFVLINQNEHIYYSPIDSIKWREFNIPVIDFTIDESKEEIHLQSLNGKCFVLSGTLDWVRTYQQDSIEVPLKAANGLLNTDAFFSKGIQSIHLTSTKWIYDKPGGQLPALYKLVIEKARIIKKDSAFIFKTKGYRRLALTFTAEELSELLSTRQVNLSFDQLAQNVSFSKADIDNYLDVLKKKRAIREEQKSWGGDFTSQIKLDNELFSNYQAVTQSINQRYLNAVYKQSNTPFFNKQADKIEVILINEDKQTLRVSNENAILFSLPWTIELNGKRLDSYQLGITTFVKSICPTTFRNFEMLLGGELLFKLIEEQIIDELIYKKGS